MDDTINQFIQDYQEIKDILLKNSQLSLASSFNRQYTNIFIIVLASKHESLISRIIIEFCKMNSSDERIIHLLKMKCLDRQYHTFFNWDSNDIGPFLTMFGKKFKDEIKSKIKDDDELNLSIKGFKIGRASCRERV